MPDPGETVTSNSLNTIADKKIESKYVKEETYTEGDNGNKIALKPNPYPSSQSVDRRVNTLSEIERTIASHVMPVNRQKVSQFAINILRKTDPQFKASTSVLDRLTRNEFMRGPKKGRALSAFEIRAHSFRQLTAHATLGTYQFNRQQVLPYMRKSLALDFQKTSLLKQLVSAITSLERTSAVKLEAIKMNTGAAAPTKVSLFTRFRTAIRDKQIEKISGNVADRMLEGYSETWNKHVAPVLSGLHEQLGVEGPKGGFNNVTRRSTGKLNQLRRKLSNVNKRTAGSTKGFDNLKNTASGIGGKLLDGIVRGGQKFRLGAGLNKFVTGRMRKGTEFFEGFNPFDDRELEKGDLTSLGRKMVQEGGIGSTSLQSVVTLLKGWQNQSLAGQNTLISHVADIKTLLAMNGSPPDNSGPNQPGGSPPLIKQTKSLFTNPFKKKSPKPNRVKYDIGKSLGQGLGPVAPDPTPTPVAENKSSFSPAAPQPSLKMPRTGVFGGALGTLKSVSGLAFNIGKSLWAKRKQSGGITGSDGTVKLSPWAEKKPSLASRLFNTTRNAFAKMPSLGLLGRYSSGPALSAPTIASPAGGATAPTIGARLFDPRAGSADAGNPQTSILSMVSQQLSGIDNTIAQGNIARAAYEKYQVARQQAADKIARASQIRAGSYEDMQRRKQAGGGRESNGQMSATAAAVAAGIGSGLSPVGGDTGGGESDSGGGVGDTVSDLIDAFGSEEDGGDDEKPTKRRRKSRFRKGREGARKRLGRLKRNTRGRRLFNKLMPDDAGRNKTFGKKMLSKGWDALKVSGSEGRLGRLAKVGIKGVGVGAIAGYGADMANDALQNSSASSGVKKLGSTVGSMASYGATGATLGSIIPGFGTLAGGAIGASLGALIANADAVSSNLNKMAVGTKKVSDGLSKTLFGKSEKERAEGQAIVDDGNKDKLNGSAPSDRLGFKKPSNDNDKSIQSRLNANKQVKTQQSYGLMQSIMKVSGKSLLSLASFLAPVGFAVGLSRAVWGWFTGSKESTDPAKPIYKYISTVLYAYGLKDHDRYKAIHSLQENQDKINNGQAKPFTDNDLANVAARFGFDSKNTDAVNYFKAWYLRRFNPAMLIIGKVLASRGHTFTSIMAANDKDVDAVLTVLKQEVAAANLSSIGLEPSVQAYNFYIKRGDRDPGRANGATAPGSNPWDPRQGGGGAGNNTGGQGGYGSNNDQYSDPNTYNPVPTAKRKKARMISGGVTQQPEYLEAYALLPVKFQGFVRKSVPLQFLLWSTSVQHGAKNAVMIFQRDYYAGMDQKSFIRSVYQDRAAQFDKLNPEDRAKAIDQLGKEKDYTLGIKPGFVITRNQAQGMVGNMYDPEGGYSGGGGGGPVATLKGSVKEKAQRAFAYLRSRKGYSPNAAAGIVGNLITESAMNESVKTGDGGRAWGLAQWHPDRRANITRALGKRWDALGFEGQLDAIDWELSTGSSVTGGKATKQALQNSRSPQEAARIFMQKFERPLDKATGGKNDRERGSNAAGVLANGGNQPLAQPPQGKPAPKPTPKPKPKPTANDNPVVPGKGPVKKKATEMDPTAAYYDLSSKMTHAVSKHAAALEQHTQQIMKSQSAGSPTTVVAAPVVNNGPYRNGETPISASMRKSAMVTGK